VGKKGALREAFHWVSSCNTKNQHNKASLKASGTACLYSQQGGVARASAPIMADLHANKELGLPTLEKNLEAT
jgi:hypothetical protein